MADTETLAGRCLASAFLAAVFITIGFWGDWFIIIIAWVMAIPLALFLGLVVGFVAAALGMTMEDPQIHVNETADIIVERSPEIIGKFQDHDIHEWVVMKQPKTENLLKCKYSRTIDMTKEFEFEPPDNIWFCIIPPGIMYIAEPEPETPAATA